MQNAHLIQRRLSFIAADGKRQTINETRLTSQTEPLVILGEAGMGKTTLLRALGDRPGYRYVLARSFIGAPDPLSVLGEANTLVIDALDEVASHIEGGNVDSVISALQKAGSPKFVLACRVADWRSATGGQAISDAYQIEPLELHLQPISSGEARDLIAYKVDGDRADRVIEHFERNGLADLFGNPQTLDLIRAVAESEDLPVSRAALFDLATKRLWFEHSARKISTELGQASEDEAFEAAGGAFASLILSGKRALSRRPVDQIAPEDLRLANAAALSDRTKLNAIVESRLFMGGVEGDPDRFSYTHRSIGEYLAARWLAKKADSSRKRRRILKLFHETPLVPSSLRGVHAWLALDKHFANSIIRTDPLGLIEYGDVSSFDTEQARLLFDCLNNLSETNPRFHRYEFQDSLRGLLQPALATIVKPLIEGPATPDGLRSMLLISLEGSELAPILSDNLKEMMLDPARTFFERRAAGNALTHIKESKLDWAKSMSDLYDLADADSIRLGVELLPQIEFKGVQDETIVRLVLAQCGLTLCEYPRKKSRRVSGVMWGFRKRLPDHRIGPILDELVTYSTLVRDSNRRDFERSDLTDLTVTLIARRLKVKVVDPIRLWSWLDSFGEDRGYHRDEMSEVSEWLRAHDETRQAIQRYALIEATGSKSVWERGWRLANQVDGLSANETDVIQLLKVLAPASEESGDCWRDVVRLCAHDEERGVAVREAAAVFALTQEDKAWLEALGNPQTPEWKIKDDKRRQKNRDKREKRWAEHRRDFTENIEKLRLGHFGSTVGPAQAYLSLYRDMGNDLAAQDRISEWLGPKLQAAAFEGFEAFLLADDPKPTAKEIANSYAEGRRWTAAYILVAAIAERVRTNKPLGDLPSERLIAALLEIRNTMILDHAKIDGVSEEIEKVLRSREGEWESYWRLRIEPQLTANKEHVDGLYQIGRSEKNDELAATLAIDWLKKFPNLPRSSEVELIDCLVGHTKLEELKEFSRLKRSAMVATDERRADWDAVAFLTDFEESVDEITSDRNSLPDFLWTLRARLGGWRDRPSPTLSAKQIAWIVTNYRFHWPNTAHPTGSTSGNTNPWDASEFLSGMINRLGGMTDESAVAEMSKLLNCKDDDYSDYIKLVRSEQKRKIVEENYSPPSLETLKSALEDRPPTTIAQLQTVMVEELGEAQKKIKSHPADWWSGFFDDKGNPKNEEACRDELLKLLGDYPYNINCEPEGHLANDKRADIRCTIDQLMLPIEVKGQWHKDLWHAVDTQLDRLYSTDWRAGRRGIYLVFWFGDEVSESKKLKSPGRGLKRPKTAKTLRTNLIARSKVAQDGRAEIVVLDMTQSLNDD